MLGRIHNVGRQQRWGMGGDRIQQWETNSGGINPPSTQQWSHSLCSFIDMPPRTTELSSRASKMKELGVWGLGRRFAARLRGDEQNHFTLTATTNSSPRLCPHSRCTNCPSRRKTPAFLSIFPSYIRLVELSLCSLSPQMQIVQIKLSASRRRRWNFFPHVNVYECNHIFARAERSKMDVWGQVSSVWVWKEAGWSELDLLRAGFGWANRGVCSGSANIWGHQCWLPLRSRKSESA